MIFFYLINTFYLESRDLNDWGAFIFTNAVALCPPVFIDFHAWWMEGSENYWEFKIKAVCSFHRQSVQLWNKVVPITETYWMK